MALVGVVLIIIAASVELVAAGLFIFHKLSPNPHLPFAMLSWVVFAVAGLILFLSGL